MVTACGDANQKNRRSKVGFLLLFIAKISTVQIPQFSLDSMNFKPEYYSADTRHTTTGMQTLA